MIDRLILLHVYYFISHFQVQMTRHSIKIIRKVFGGSTKISNIQVLKNYSFHKYCILSQATILYFLSELVCRISPFPVCKKFANYLGFFMGASSLQPLLA